MIKHYLLISLRNLLKTKLHTFINIMGLSTGFACAVLVIFFVKDELTYDSFHSNSENIYRLYYKAERTDGTIGTNTVTPLIASHSLKENFGEVTGITPWIQSDFTVKNKDQAFDEEMILTHKDFFNMFDFEILEGSIEGIFDKRSDMVITSTMAEKYFGSQSPIGENLELLVGTEPMIFEVKAVIQNPPSNSSLQYEFLLSEDVGRKLFPPDLFDTWNFVFAENYIQLQSGADKAAFEAKLPEFVKVQQGDENDGRLYELHLQPIEDIHLNNELPPGIAAVSDPQFTYILSGIALLVLLMAGINFVNLSLGRSFGRAREIGIKKAVGAGRTQLIFQFLGEALIIAGVSMLLGLALAYFTLPVFNQLSGKVLVYSLSPVNLSLILATTVLVGLLAGFYPAMILSSFRPTKVLKGGLNIGSGKNVLRKIMLAVQLIFSVFLITSAVLMQKQMSFMRNKDLGFDRQHLVTIPMTVSQDQGFDEILIKGLEKGTKLLNQTANKTYVESASLTAHTFEPGGWMELGYTDSDNNIQRFHFNAVSAGYIKTTGMEIVSGRDFQEGNEADKRRSVIVNETFVKEFGIESPVGARIPHDRFEDHEIIGVVKDFHFSSLHEKVQAAAIAINPSPIFAGINNLSINSSFIPKVMLRLKSENISSALKDVEDMFSQTYPGEVFSYNFVDDSIEEQYEDDRNAESVIQAATVIATIIGALGLFGLVSLTLSAKMKEISIRKLLGANLSHVLLSLSSEFFIIVMIAIGISVPLTWKFVSEWLQDFEYRINPGWIDFLMGGVIMLIIAVVSMAYQSFKVAVSRPVDELKRE